MEKVACPNCETEYLGQEGEQICPDCGWEYSAALNKVRHGVIWMPGSPLQLTIYQTQEIRVGPSVDDRTIAVTPDAAARVG